MAKDEQGLIVTGTSASAAASDRAVAEYLGWKGDPIATLDAAVKSDEGFVLGHTAIASLLLLNGFRGDHPAVINALASARLRIGGATAREVRHFEAALAWADGLIVRATEIWEDVLLDHPTDLLALRFAHDSYFYLAHSQSIRDSIARVLPAWDRSRPNYGFVLGEYAFGLEEAGDLRRAEEVGREAVALNPEDAWAVHAVAHVFEMESRQEEGIAFLRETNPHWTGAAALSVHLGWHRALYLIEGGRFAEVLAEYDSFVAPRIAGDSLLDLVDASALLWRLELAGADVGGRWDAVADQWASHIDEHVLVFNDLHIALAAARSGKPGLVRRLLDSLDAYTAGGGGDNREITRDVGRALIDAVVAFAAGEYRAVIGLILPIRFKIVRIGGSHAQRDLLTQTLIAAAERAGDIRLARALLAERVALRPTERTRRAFAQTLGQA